MKDEIRMAVEVREDEDAPGAGEIVRRSDAVQHAGEG